MSGSGASISLHDCNVTQDGETVPPSESIGIFYQLENTGQTEGTVTVRALANGQEVDSSVDDVQGDFITGNRILSFVPADMGLGGQLNIEVEVTGEDAVTESVGLSPLSRL